MELHDKVVLITGAARGIGAETARTLIAHGALVALVDSNGPAVKQTAADLGERAVGIEADVRDMTSVEEAVRATVEQFGGVDVVVANAGICGPSAPVSTVAPAAFEAVVDVNLLGVWRTVRAALPQVIERRGYVLCIASIAAAIPMPTMAAYGASKAGVDAFGRALRLELAPRGVGVGVAWFGGVDTDMLREMREATWMDQLLQALPGPLGRMATVEEVATAVVGGIRGRRKNVYAPRWVLGILLTRPAAQLESTLARLPFVANLIAGAR